MRIHQRVHESPTLEYPDHGPTAPDNAMLLCPNGHLNASGDQFCGQCGIPIGANLAAAVAPELAETIRPTSRRSLSTPIRVFIIAAASIAIVAITATLAYFLTRQGDSLPIAQPILRPAAPSAPPTDRPAPGAQPTAVLPLPPPAAGCSTPPVLSAESINVVPAGLAVSTAIASSCTGADVVSNSAIQITVIDGARDVAAGTFNMSSDPVILPPGQAVSRTFVFPAGMYWLPAELVSQRATMNARYTGHAGTQSTPEQAGAQTLTATTPSPPQFGSPDSAATVGLRALADADGRVVGRDLQQWWIPQVSSKRPGLVAEGITWTNADILREHLALRQRFSQARLVWSGDWTSFSEPNWWVTIVGVPMSTPQEANGWCDAQGLDAGHCFAKMISSVLGPEGTTSYRK